MTEPIVKMPAADLQTTGERRLTAIEFQQLGAVPAAVGVIGMDEPPPWKPQTAERQEDE